MSFSLYATFLGTLFGWLMALLSIFLILLILVQRGRGGGLTGALGGPGGQSAFGSKAGDMFTRITFTVAGIWILLCALAMFTLGNARNVVIEDEPPALVSPGGEDATPLQSDATGDDSTTGIDLSNLNQLGDSLGAPPSTTSDAPAGEDTPAADETPAGEEPAAAVEPAGEEPADN